MDWLIAYGILAGTFILVIGIVIMAIVLADSDGLDLSPRESLLWFLGALLWVPVLILIVVLCIIYLILCIWHNEWNPDYWGIKYK